MAQIPKLGEEITESELETQTTAETLRLSEPSGFDELLDEIAHDEEEDRERRKKIIELQRENDEEQQESEAVAESGAGGVADSTESEFETEA